MTPSHPPVRRPLASRGAAALAVLLLVAACGDPTSSAADLRVARARWQRSRPASYAYTFTRSCECLPGTTGPVRIEVRGDVVTSRTYAASGQAVDPQWADIFPTIDGLFVTMETAAARGETVEATFDPRYGYPHGIAIDRKHWEVDGGANITIRDFTPLR